MDVEPTVTAAPARSDLKVRTLSALVMVALSGFALAVGGYAWLLFVVFVAAGVLWEWSKLARAITPKPWARALWLAAGFVYVVGAAEVLMILRLSGFGLLGVLPVLFVLGAVIFTDVGAYFAGRTFGGPKIAPGISPSKTWSGLAGGMLGATLFIFALSRGVIPYIGAHADTYYVTGVTTGLFGKALVFGALIAIVAQAGDFFESWMKRRAGVKDSGTMIPGHGGLFDRVDGLLAVCFVLGVLMAASTLGPRHEVRLMTTSTMDR